MWSLTRSSINSTVISLEMHFLAPLQTQVKLGVGSGTCFLTSPPGDSDQAIILRTAGLGHQVALDSVTLNTDLPQNRWHLSLSFGCSGEMFGRSWVCGSTRWGFPKGPKQRQGTSKDTSPPAAGQGVRGRGLGEGASSGRKKKGPPPGGHLGQGMAGLLWLLKSKDGSGLGSSRKPGQEGG